VVQLSHPLSLLASFYLVPLLPLILRLPANAPSLADYLHVLLHLVSMCKTQQALYQVYLQEMLLFI
jgi:hypothetical protein